MADEEGGEDYSEFSRHVTFLFEFKGFRKELSCYSCDVCSTLEGELKSIGVAESDAHVELCSAAKQPSGLFLLQRFSSKWDCYVNVDCTSQVQDGDRLSLITNPVGFKETLSGDKTMDVLSKFQRPSGAEAKTIAKLFPTAKKFDPMAKLVVADAQRKKKAAVPRSNPRPVKITTILMQDYLPQIPKGKARKRLVNEGRVRTLSFTRDMTAESVRDKIIGAFKIQDYTILACDTLSQSLVIGDQDLNGEGVIGRRGCLYLCETFKDPLECVESCSNDVYEVGYTGPSTSTAQKLDSSDTDFRRPTKRKRLSLPKPQQRSTFQQKSPVENPVEVIDDSSNHDEQQPLKDTRKAYIEESRRLVAEQDEAYAESLRIDREKAKRVELRRLLKDKWKDASQGIKFSLRFGDSTKTECYVTPEKSALAFYEIAFAFNNNIATSFSIFTSIPRVLVTENMLVSEVVNYSTALFVEEDKEEGRDPLILFTNIECAATSGKDDVKKSEFEIIDEATARREKYHAKSGFLKNGNYILQPIERNNVYEDVMNTYKDNTDVLNYAVLQASYRNELAVDAGGVCRDLFSAFWEEAYLKHFDGETLLIPTINPNTEITTFSVLGTILSHGFLVSGFLPVRIAFPILASALLGLDVEIPSGILLESLVDFLGAYDSDTLRACINSLENSFTECTQSKLIDLLSRLGCTEMPTPLNLKRLVLSIAKHQFFGKPLGSLFKLQSGVPVSHHDFWQQFTVSSLFNLYKALNATPNSVLQLLKEPLAMNSAEDRIFRYLLTFVSNCKQDLLRRFLRFVTGSSVLMFKNIMISFNNIDEFARRPIAHTCDPGLELSRSYATFPEFDHEVTMILLSEHSWAMDAI